MNKIRRETKRWIIENGLPYFDALPYLDEFKCIRLSTQITARCNILNLFLAVADDNNAISFVRQVVEKNDLKNHLSLREKNVLKNDSTTAQEKIDFSWYQESLLTFLWALNIFESLDDFTSEADFSQVDDKIPPRVSFDDFNAKADLRQDSQIIEYLDKYYYLHWLSKRETSGLDKLLNTSIIRERRKSLEWILNCESDWDDIVLDT